MLTSAAGCTTQVIVSCVLACTVWVYGPQGLVGLPEVDDCLVLSMLRRQKVAVDVVAGVACASLRPSPLLQ